MTTPSVDTLVEDYLGRLRRAAQALPPDRRDELVEGIAEHLQAARAAGATADEAAVRTLLDRLGEPEEIVAAARDDGEPPAYGYGPGPDAPTFTRPPSTGLELAAVLLLTVGSFVPVVGWLLGVALLWSSGRWSWREKLLGTLVVPGGPGSVLIFGLIAGGRTCSSSIATTPDGTVISQAESCGGFSFPPAVGIVLLLVSLIGPFVVASILYSRARARAAAEKPVVIRTPQGAAWGGLEIGAVGLLSLGSFVAPVVGPFVGLALAWASPRWTQREKTIATVLALLPLLLLLLVVVLTLVL